MSAENENNGKSPGITPDGTPAAAKPQAAAQAMPAKNIEIKHRWTGQVLSACEAADVKAALKAAVGGGADLSGANLRSANLSGANLSGADLSGANLSGANLSGADLSGANLRSADLSGADLSGANLRSANLSGANLSGADLSGANLSGANLSGADLSGANLRSANLSGANLRSANLSDSTILPTAESWFLYVREVLPALLTAGGKQLGDVATSETWNCHTWANCPMAVAFDTHHENETPLLLRPRVQQFVQLFDAGLIPCPTISTPGSPDNPQDKTP